VEKRIIPMIKGSAHLMVVALGSRAREPPEGLVIWVSPRIGLQGVSSMGFKAQDDRGLDLPLGNIPISSQ
jgi:hypothetical protein